MTFLLPSLFFALTSLDAQNARKDAGGYKCISMLLSTDLQDFMAAGLQLRDNKFLLCLIVLVAFDF